KENVIIGKLIPAGTGMQVYFEEKRKQEAQKAKEEAEKAKEEVAQ
ncbi:MAG: hypothetical protein GX196_09295, partial [Clostridiaceae bacterium]|nr:hypothetical protein [Clostridiaceae bacterium]